MSLKKETKKKIKKDYALHEKDTGSIEVQVGLLTQEIKELVRHLTTHKHDFSSKRGLLRKVAQRRKLLRYLEKTDPESYEKIIKKIRGK
ncbi:MAG: 30S ribosomal protein S15 [Patescibacteria group bacterium]|nr:30S ribosomal protein S15 [Patescibacteria group bacterium]